MKNVIFHITQRTRIVDWIGRQRLFSPITLIILGYLLILFVGALILMLPISTMGQGISFTDALFTSTSAITVTGLNVNETGTFFSFFGQLIILILIQIGGIGYMALFGFFLLSGQGRISFEHRMLLRETLNSPTVKGISKTAKRIFYFILTFELIGALFLAIHWWGEYKFKSIWYGIFHSIAAFNNAGFDILATGNFESLGRYVTDYHINLIIASLIILGGLGFYVLSDIYRYIRKRKTNLSYQTIVVCIVTVLLLVGGTLSFLIFEYNNPATLAGHSMMDKIMISFFNSVTPRTAGFATVPVSGFFPITLVSIVVLMFIGASPGGTGGGIKTTTVAIFWAYLKTCITSREQVVLFFKRIINDRVNKAFAITFLSFLLIAVVSMLIVEVDNVSVLAAIFETTSAFGTVGLTMGLTPTLSIFSKYLIMATMFLGKIGVLTLILLFLREKHTLEVMLPRGELTM